MKRWTALFLSLMLLLQCAFAWAEARPDWEEVAQALLTDEPQPVPPSWRLQAASGQLSLREGLDPQIMNILILSSDALEMTDSLGRTDLMLLCSVHLDTGDVQLISLPETALIPVKGLPGPIRAKFVNCFGGPLLTVKTMNEWLELNIARYCAVNEGAFIRVVDLLGGVKMELTRNEGEALGLPEGENILKGESALRYVRLRRAGESWERPRKLLERLFRQLQENGVDAAFSIAEGLLSALDTNLTTGDVFNLIFSLLGRPSSGAVETMAMTLEDAVDGAAWCRRVVYGEP